MYKQKTATVQLKCSGIKTIVSNMYNKTKITKYLKDN
jgi:hypothetical protein